MPICAAVRGHQRLGTRDRLALAEERTPAERQRLGQPLALVDIEHGEALEERHLAAVLVARFGDRLLRHDPSG